MKKILLTILGLAALSPLAAGEEEAPQFLRFIPMADLPVWDEKLKKKIRVGKMIPGGKPPKVSMVSGGEVVPLDLMLRVLTPLQKLPPATKGLILKNGQAPESPEWIKKAKPSTPLTLGVLLPDAADNLWFKPRMLMLDDDASSFPVGTIRFVNVSNQTVYVTLGGERGQKFGIAPGKAAKPKTIKRGFNSVETIFKHQTRGKVEIWNNSIKVEANQRVQCFFYNANLGPGKTVVKFIFLPETIPALR